MQSRLLYYSCALIAILGCNKKQGAHTGLLVNLVACKQRAARSSRPTSRKVIRVRAAGTKDHDGVAATKQATTGGVDPGEDKDIETTRSELGRARREERAMANY